MYNLNFSLSELINSETAKKNKISNIPDISSLDNILNLIFYVLQPLRERLNKPIKINSGYRCKKLNALVGGVATSQHLKGQAADIVVQGMSVKNLIDFIKASQIEYDQLIDEKTWVHISFAKGKNRGQFIKNN